MIELYSCHPVLVEDICSEIIFQNFGKGSFFKNKVHQKKVFNLIIYHQEKLFQSSTI